MLFHLLSDPVFRGPMGIAGARLAADEYSIEIIGPQYERLSIRALQSHGAREDSSVFSRRGIHK